MPFDLLPNSSLRSQLNSRAAAAEAPSEKNVVAVLPGFIPADAAPLAEDCDFVPAEGLAANQVTFSCCPTGPW